MKKLITKLKKLFGFYKNKESVFDESTTSIVIAGVENSPKWGSCSGALRDCDTFKKIVSKASDNFNIVVLKNEAATVAAWKSAVEKAIQKPLAIIFYSGHGGSDKTHVLGSGSNEEDGIDEFLCLYDKPLLDDEIWEIISKSTGKVFLVFDCCHSGTMFKSIIFGEDSEQTEIGKFHPIDFSKFFKENLKEKEQQPSQSTDGFSMLCWSACADNTVARGSSFGGIFTNAIEKLFGVGDTYESLGNKLSSNKSLNDIEKIQITEIGESFKKDLFCR